MKGERHTPGRYVMGLDGGGTKTVCAIVDGAGHTVGYGQGGPANINFVERRLAVMSFENAIIEALLALAPIGPHCLDAICVASPTPCSVYLPLLEKHVALKGPLVVTGEADAALAGTTTNQWGLVVLAGTGSFAWLKTQDGRVHSIGGWGAMLGDEGSAHWIGLEGLKAAIRGYDGRGPCTILSESIAEALGLAELRLLISEVYQGRLRYRHGVASIAPIVAEAANKGDSAAIDILQRAAYELALAARGCVIALDAQGEPIPCILSGGVFEAKDAIINPLETLFRSWLPNVTILPARVPQVVGTCAIALQRAGVEITENLLEKLQSGIQKTQNRRFDPFLT
ncbi:MAG: hypothetical protein GX322_10230 [Firmicutes bacterium]|nr:hypothetical protein [Bacillota bacterium]